MENYLNPPAAEVHEERGCSLSDMGPKLRAAILGTEPARDYPEDTSHENGNYSCICVTCGAIFTGHKRRMQCKICATEPAREES